MPTPPSRSLTSTVSLLVVTAGLCLPSLARVAEGQCRYLARERAFVEDGTQSNVSVATNDPGGQTQLGRDVFFADDTDVIGDSVRIGNDSSVDDVQANELRLGRNVSIRGSISGAMLPVEDPFCPIPDFDCGGPNVVVERGSSEILTPGSYGSIRIQNGGSVQLTPGTYDTCDFIGARNVTVLAGDGTTLNVVDRFALGNDSIFGPGGGGSPASVFIAGSRRVRIGKGSDVTASVSAPEASVSIGNNSSFAGDLCAERFDTGKTSTLSCTDTTPTTTSTLVTTTTTVTSSSTSSSTVPSSTSTSSSSTSSSTATSSSSSSSSVTSSSTTSSSSTTMSVAPAFVDQML